MTSVTTWCDAFMMRTLSFQTKVLVGHIGYGNAVVLQQGTASKVPATDGSGSFQVSCVPEAGPGHNFCIFSQYFCLSCWCTSAYSWEKDSTQSQK